MSMSFGLLISFAMIMFVVNYMSALQYLKVLRGESSKNLKWYHIILLCVLFGGPVLLITYIFPEIRFEDSTHHYCYLICGIAFTILQILLIFLLVYYGVVPLEQPIPPENVNPTNLLF